MKPSKALPPTPFDAWIVGKTGKVQSVRIAFVSTWCGDTVAKSDERRFFYPRDLHFSVNDAIAAGRAHVAKWRARLDKQRASADTYERNLNAAAGRADA